MLKYVTHLLGKSHPNIGYIFDIRYDLFNDHEMEFYTR